MLQPMSRGAILPQVTAAERNASSMPLAKHSLSSAAWGRTATGGIVRFEAFYSDCSSWRLNRQTMASLNRDPQVCWMNLQPERELFKKNAGSQAMQ
jgi:hypothetical protein